MLSRIERSWQIQISVIFNLTHMLATQQFTLATLSTVGRHINAIHSVIETLTISTTTFFNLIVQAGLNRVTPGLHSPNQLYDTVHSAYEKWYLTSPFPDSQLNRYFSVLESTITSTHILAHVPFRSQDVF